MVKHTQKSHRQQPTNCLSVFDHFVGMELKGLTSIKDIWLLYFQNSQRKLILSKFMVSSSKTVLIKWFLSKAHLSGYDNFEELKNPAKNWRVLPLKNFHFISTGAEFEEILSIHAFQLLDQHEKQNACD